MYKNGNILIGRNELGDATLLLNKANRHGLITGASGSGKNITLKVLAESFSEAGVPVFLSDIKGDLAGLIKLGSMETISSRLESLKITDFEVKGFPVIFLDVYSKNGSPIRTTVKSIGAKLLARMLDLTDAQEGVLAITKIAIIIALFFFHIYTHYSTFIIQYFLYFINIFLCYAKLYNLSNKKE